MAADDVIDDQAMSPIGPKRTLMRVAPDIFGEIVAVGNDRYLTVNMTYLS